MRVQSQLLDERNIQSGLNTYYRYGHMGPQIGLGFNADISAGRYLGFTAAPYAGIGPGCQQAVGNMLFTCSWGAGVRVYRIANDGTLSQIYYSATPQYANSIAVCTVNKKFFVNRCDAAGIYEFDWTNPDAISCVRVSVKADGLPFDRAGVAYTQGLACVNGWLYGMPNGAEYHTVVWRMPTGNIRSGIEQITIINRGSLTMYAGGAIHYFPAADSVVLWWQYTSAWGIPWPVIVRNASRSQTDPSFPCKAFYGGFTGLNGNYANYLCFPDPADSTRWTYGDYLTNVGVYDMTAVFGSTSPNGTKLSGSSPVVSVGGFTWVRKKVVQAGGWNGQRMVAPHPDHNNLLLQHPRDGAADGWGWYDQENFNFVGPGYGPEYTSAGAVTYTPWWYATASPLYAQFAGCPMKLISADGTVFYAIVKYGANWGGGGIYVLNAASRMDLHLDGYLVFGPIAFAGGEKIHRVSLTGISDQIFQPAGTALAIQLSNDNGATWEDYSPLADHDHVFGSVGAQLLIKFVLIGYQGVKSPYWAGDARLGVTLISAVEPDVSEVRSGRGYGADGNEFVGTMVGIKEDVAVSVESLVAINVAIDRQIIVQVAASDD